MSRERLAELGREFRAARERIAESAEPFAEAGSHDAACEVVRHYERVGGHNPHPVCTCALAERQRIVELETALDELRTAMNGVRDEVRVARRALAKRGPTAQTE